MVLLEASELKVARIMICCWPAAVEQKKEDKKLRQVNGSLAEVRVLITRPTSRMAIRRLRSHRE